jgi:hypothetical protein
MAVGYNNFDVPAMTAAGVLATNAPDVLTETTADMGFALLMAAARRMTEGERFPARWRSGPLGLRHAHRQDVHGATLGILGMGRIGQAIARRGALGFGMKVIYHNRSAPAGRARAAEVNARYVSKQDAAAAVRPRGARAAVFEGSAPHHRRRRTGADEAHRHADQHRARRHRRRRGAGRPCAKAASPQRGWMCSRANPKSTPTCWPAPTSCSPRTSPAPPCPRAGDGRTWRRRT